MGYHNLRSIPDRCGRRKKETSQSRNCKWIGGSFDRVAKLPESCFLLFSMKEQRPSSECGSETLFALLLSQFSPVTPFSLLLHLKFPTANHAFFLPLYKK